MRIVRNHGKSKQEAREKVDTLLPAMLERHGDRVTEPEGAWDGDVFSFSFRAMGYSIEGTLRTSVEGELDRILAE